MTPEGPRLFKAALGPTAQCLSPELLAAKASHPDVQRHLDSCAHCRTELAMLREFEMAEPRADELASVEWIESELARRAVAAPATPVSAWERIRAWAGKLRLPQRRGPLSIAFASLFLVIAAGWYLRHDGGPQRLPAPGNEVLRSGRAVGISPLGQVDRPPSEFRWEAVPGAATYQVRLMEVDGTVIWSGDSSGTNIGLGPQIRGRLTPGRAFQWSVLARNAAGEQIASSDLQRFDILLTRR